MYCSSCGTALNSGLSYCNRCGVALSAKTPGAMKTSQVSQESLVWAIVSVSVGGLAILIGLMAVMQEAHFDMRLLVAFTLLSFLILIGANSVFIWLILRSKGSAEPADSKTRLKELAVSELVAKPVGVFAEPALSVSEHTTRTLEPVNTE